MSRGFARSGWSRGSEILTPTDLAASATPHTKGAWVELDAAAAFDVAGIWMHTDITVGVTATDTSMLLDIGTGGAGSEAVVVPNVPVGGINARVPFFLPIHIPAGTRIAARIQGAVVSDAFRPMVTLVFGGSPGMWGGYTIAETIGVDTATSGPTTGDLVDNAWDEAVASTANPYRALTFHPCHVAGSTVIAGAGVPITVDVGMGAGGSEVLLGSFRPMLSASEILTSIFGPDFIEISIPAGSRLAIRKNGTGDLSAALIGWR